MRKRVYGAAAILIVLVELALCFLGPIAFLRKPSLILYPLFSFGLDDEETERLAAHVEKSMARTGSFAIVSRQFLVDWFVRTDPSYDRSRLKAKDLDDALTISRELGLERVAIALAFATEGRVELSVAIRDVRDGEVLRTGRWVSRDLASLLGDRDGTGEPIDLPAALAVPTRGVGIAEWLILLLLGAQLALGAAALLGRAPGGWVEPVWVLALILFVFSYIHALSANMDYVQRFIASSGQLKLASSTALEQGYAFLRFGPLLILGGVAYVLQRRTGSPPAQPERSSIVRRHAARWSLPWVLVSAALFSLSFPSPVALGGLGPLAWISLVPLFVVLIVSSPVKAVLYAVTFGALQALVINYWHGTYSYVTLHVVTIVLVVEFLIFAIPLVFLVRRCGRWGSLAVPAAWVVFDWLRSVGVLGYPWGIAGVTQYAFVPLIQIASVTGVWGVDFVVVGVNAGLAWAVAFRPEDLAVPGVVGASPRSPRSASARYRAATLAGTAALLAGAVLPGAAMLARQDAGMSALPAERTLRVALVQENTDPRKEVYRDHLARLYALTDQVLAMPGGKPDLVVWPEGGFPVDIRYSQRADMAGSDWADLTRSFLDYQAGMGTWLVSGEQDHIILIGADGKEAVRNFNSSVLIDARGQIRGYYHKMHLVPFSERFPLDRERFAALYALFQKYDISNWEVGTERTVYTHDRARFYTPICFEDLFPDEVRRFVLGGAQIIVNLSNDYWSLSPVEGRQHGLHALFRAVENRRPLVRATDSGYTVVVDAAGRILPGSPAPYTEGTMTADLAIPDDGLTPYTRWGDWFPKVCLVWAAVCLAAGLLIPRHAGRSPAPGGKAPPP